MQKKLFIILSIILLSSIALAQTTLQTSGLNEVQYIYRTAADSLNSYFSDSFAFNMSYRNLSFGMKFIAELPKYSVNQDELIDELSPASLSLGWKELYLRYNKDNFQVQGGTMSETFGSGMLFRAWEDMEFDEDYRLQGLNLSYESKLKFKALYGALPNATDKDVWDLAYGSDLAYPVTTFLTLGASALALRTAQTDNTYNQRDVYGARAQFITPLIEASLEYGNTNLYKRENSLPELNGTALYANLSANLYPIQIGAAYKRYDQFSYRLQDLPLANYHNEPIEDTNSGLDEEGAQIWLNWNVTDAISYNLDYAEAWNLDGTIAMNDLFTSLDYTFNESNLGFEYSHIEKNWEESKAWTKEITPAVHYSLPLFGRTLSIKAEHKYLAKQKMETVNSIYQAVITSHWEPRIQADINLGKLSLSASTQSHWEEISELMESRYWANLEAKYSLFTHTDLTLFLGKEAGGKVCRNGICRYVAPFEGLKLEIATRF